MHERTVAFRCELLLLLKAVSLEIVPYLNDCIQKMRVLMKGLRERTHTKKVIAGFDLQQFLSLMTCKNNFNLFQNQSLNHLRIT